MSSIIAQKLEQAHAILNELNLDAWMVFVRESSHGGDQTLPLLHDGSFTWQTALIVTRAGDRIAVVGKLDDGPVRSAGIWTDVVTYVQGIREPLVETIARLDPRTLALNFSVDDYSADGLSHGMFLLLHCYFAGTPYLDRFVSAEEVVAALRGRKTSLEIARMQTAVDIAQNIFREVGEFACCGQTEREIAEFMLAATDRHGVEPAWHHPCPIVNSGPSSMVGHGLPSDVKIEPGHVLHIDFGVKYEGYCSDLQRCWYVPRDGERAPPAEVSQAFDAIVRAISIAAASVRPGVPGCEVDAAARGTIVEAGYPEYGHALGHHVGRSAHDGGGILGPAWPRYGKTPWRVLEIGNVVTLEPSISDAAGRGCLGLEEMVVVTDNGCRWLSDRQTTLPCLGRGKTAG